MGKGSLRRGWLLQLFAAVGYALVFIAEQPFSHAHFVLKAGVRLIFLLLVPYRYWAALAVGEAVPNAFEVFPCLDAFGATWVAFRSIPMIMIAMPIVWFCRSTLGLFPTKRLVDFKALLICVLACTIAWSGYSYAAVNMVHTPSGASAANPMMIVGYLAGNYFGILATVPWALIARFDLPGRHWRSVVDRMVNSRLVIDCVVLLAPAIVILGWVSMTASVEVRQVTLMALFMPVGWLTVKHGWRAAAVGGTLAILSAAIALPNDNYGPEVTVTEAFLALTITALFALGARITSQLMQEDDETRDVSTIQRTARQTFQLSEQRIRTTAQMLEYIAGTLHVANGRLLDHMKRILPNIESEAYFKQALSTQRQIYFLAESLHPIAWRERGLPAALNETVARALDEAGIAYRCTISGRGFTRLNPSVLLATYRLACEAVVHVSARLACNSIQLTLRGGETNGRRWVVVRVSGIVENRTVANAVFRSTERQRLASKLGANGLNLSELLNHARIFNGAVHVRSPDERTFVTILLHDAPKEVQRRERTSAPLRLWVR